MTSDAQRRFNELMDELDAAKEKRNGPALYFVGFMLGIMLLLMFAGLLIFAAWNLGVVSAVAAAGGHVSTINYGAAFGLGILLALTHGVLKAGKVPA